MLILGIDDSGRGPIVGPMVIAGCLIERKNEKELKKLGVRDSKLISPTRRRFLFNEIKKRCIDFKIIKIIPEEIDKRINSRINLNKIEAIKMAKIINHIIEKNKNKIKGKLKVIIDCPSINIEKWKAYLKQFIENKNMIIFCIQHKADKNHVVCSAASILAKVTRDNEIEKIKKKINFDFGSGYPSDPKTIEFLKLYSKKFENYGIFRKCWQTWNKHQIFKQQKKLFDFS